MSMFEVQLNVSDAQMRKLHNGHKVQLSSEDIGVGQSFMVTKKMNTKIKRAMNNGKGLRVDLNDLGLQMGGAILDDMKKYSMQYGLPVAKTVAQMLLPVASQAIGDKVTKYTGSDLAGKVASNVTNTLGRTAVQEIPEGRGFKKDLAKYGKTIGIATAKAVLPSASKALGEKVTQYTGSDLAGQLTSTVTRQVGNQVIADASAKPATTGGRIRYKKGSAEARAYMASLRARKSGGSFRPNGEGGSFRPTGGAMMQHHNIAMMPNSHMFNGVNSQNGNPMLAGMTSHQSLYNDSPRVFAKHGKGLETIY